MNYKVMRLRVMLLQCKLFCFVGLLVFIRMGSHPTHPREGMLHVQVGECNTMFQVYAPNAPIINQVTLQKTG